MKVGYAWVASSGLGLGLHGGLHHNGSLKANESNHQVEPQDYDLHFKKPLPRAQPQYKAPAAPFQISGLVNVNYGQLTVRDPKPNPQP